jgi:hypothetical protein
MKLVRFKNRIAFIESLDLFPLIDSGLLLIMFNNYPVLVYQIMILLSNVPAKIDPLSFENYRHE